ncbi:VTT domain-containing protein [Hellea balneolensis]|uniref:VTT domain-containing protein n=1 Tax=Hellea balneolensis TaxID=287478 RepID=UPI00047A62DB
MFWYKVSLIIVVSFLLALAAHFLGYGTAETAQRLASYIQAWPEPLGLTLLFLGCFFLFLTVAPLGSFTILVAGFLWGPIAGVVQFSALCLSSYALYIWTAPKGQNYAYQRIIKNGKALELAERFQLHPLKSVCVLRLVPVIPSCVCVLTCSAFSIPGRALFTGTLLSGWVRPVLLAYVGSQTLTILELVN